MFYCFVCWGQDKQQNQPLRIITLAPHLTEIVFALGKGDQLVAVSDYSDFPKQANSLPSVVSFNGVNFEQIVRFAPDIILTWEGGNKPQDLARLKSLGYALYHSAPVTLDDIAKEIIELGELLNAKDKAQQLTQQFNSGLSELRERYQSDKPTRVFYYMWPKPLMTIGKNAWANQLLEVCGTSNIFTDVSVDYPEVSLEQVVKRQPEYIVAAMRISQADAQTNWQNYTSLLNAKVIAVNPDLLHRFTPRLLLGLQDLCVKLN